MQKTVRLLAARTGGSHVCLVISSHAIHPSTSASVSAAIRGNTAAIIASVCPGPLVQARRTYIEHSSDPRRWRDTESDNVRRAFAASNREAVGGSGPAAAGAAAAGSGGVGVPLGSAEVRRQKIKELEEGLLATGKGDDTRFLYGCAVAAALILIACRLLIEYVPPVPSPEYMSHEEEEEHQRRAAGETTKAERLLQTQERLSVASIDTSDKIQFSLKALEQERAKKA